MLYKYIFFITLFFLFYFSIVKRKMVYYMYIFKKFIQKYNKNETINYKIRAVIITVIITVNIHILICKNFQFLRKN